MKAVVVERYGPPEVARIEDVPMPGLGETDVLVRVRATTVNSGDARVRALRVPRGLSLMMRLALGWNGPKQKIGGFDMAGEVEAVGGKVTAFKPGDRVLGSNGFKFGCHAEFVALPADGTMVKLPDDMSFADAVALPFGGATSLYYFKAGGLKAGESILINGASGAVGVIAVQLAKHMGAEVTAVTSTKNMDLVRSLGADHVIDYTKEDVTRGEARFDVIMDTHGNMAYGRVRHLLKPGGRCLLIIGDLWQMLQARWTPAVISGNEEGEAVNAEVYGHLVELAETGRIRPVIGKTLAFEEIVAAYRLVDGGHKVGALVLTLDAA